MASEEIPAALSAFVHSKQKGTDSGNSPPASGCSENR